MKAVEEIKATYQKRAEILKGEGSDCAEAAATRKPVTESFDYLYVGVSPKGRYGYNYWYVDEERQTQANTYVWVNMGRRNTEQIVYVDSVRYCKANDVPYPIDRTKRVLRQTTEEEAKEAESLWREENPWG